MHTSSSWIRKSSELTLKYFVKSSRFIPDSPTKILLNLLLKKIWFHLSKNSGTLASVICYLRSIQIICINLGEHLLLSSIDKNVDFVALLWENFMFQADNKEISFARKENMPYPRFTKVIISHFISKDKTISMRNRINLHIVRDDTLLGTLKFISKTQDYQKYGTLIPEEMINQDIKDSKAYKTYLAYATRVDTPKKARKFKKPASPLKKQTLVLEDKPAKKSKHADKSIPAQVDVSSKNPSRKKSAGVVIRDTPGGNLKVHEMIIKKDSKIVKEKVKMKSIALKAKKESSNQECSTSGTKSTPWHGEEDDEKVKDETCLVAHTSSEVCSESSYFSDENSSIDDIALDNEYDK
ncbi:hypothetical protein Tco_0984751 [Tanacetum coccineum]